MRMESIVPCQYRLAQIHADPLTPGGRIVLQGAYQWHNAEMSGIEWREIPMVHIDVKGNVIDDPTGR
jgi:D-lyxose ketol-isomerase